MTDDIQHIGENLSENQCEIAIPACGKIRRHHIRVSYQTDEELCTNVSRQADSSGSYPELDRGCLQLSPSCASRIKALL